MTLVAMRRHPSCRFLRGPVSPFGIVIIVVSMSGAKALRRYAAARRAALYKERKWRLNLVQARMARRIMSK